MKMNEDSKYVLFKIHVIVYKVISTSEVEYISANLIRLSNNHARSHGNSRRHLILDAIFVMISDAHKVNKPAVEYRFCEFATRKNMDLYSRNYVNSSNWISPFRPTRFVRESTHTRETSSTLMQRVLFLNVTQINSNLKLLIFVENILFRPPKNLFSIKHENFSVLIKLRIASKDSIKNIL